MSVRLRRLQAEYEKLKRLFEDHPYIRIVETAGNPPDRYTVEYRLKGLVQEKDEIQVRELHRAKITLGPNFPKEMPQCVMLTPVFHPNIDHLAICTEDIGSAGQTIDQLIVFIGEMITYQAYNIQSPRNGEAAQWAREHAAEFPLESVSLTPALLLEGGALTPLTAQSTPALPSPAMPEPAQPMPEPAPPIPVPAPPPLPPELERCHNCGINAAAAPLQRCSSGHLACPECGLVCANCRKLLCVSCALKACSACGRVVCGDCFLVCAGCRHAFCLQHVSRCSVCGRYECAACAGRCASSRTDPPDPWPVDPPHNEPTQVDLPPAPPSAYLAAMPAQVKPDYEPTLAEFLPPPTQVDQFPAGPQFESPADPVASSTPLYGQAPSSDHGSDNAAGAGQDGKQSAHATILLTADELAGVPVPSIARSSRQVRIEPELRRRPSGKAIAALAFGIAGLPLLGILLGWFAILFAALAKREFRVNPALTGQSLATAALVLGILDILVWVTLIAIYGSAALRDAAPPMPSRTPSLLTLLFGGISF
jgi:ubiquitin-protein ligase